jgi:5'-methylthioadenosine/S-adenosylhomocysteine nucleosidase
VTIIAVVGIPSETVWLCRRLRGAAMEQDAAGHFWKGQYQAHDLVVVQCAVGKINAAMAVQRLIDHHAPQIILNLGSAGAIAPQLRVGDIVIGSRIVPYDAGVFLERGFVTTGNGLPRRPDLHWRFFSSDPRLLGLAKEAAQNLPDVRASRDPSSNVWMGPVASGDQVVFADETKRWLHRTFGALAVENEGAAVAQVATAHGLPWLPVRGISDTADARTAFDYTPLLRYADEPTGWLGWARFRYRWLAHLMRSRQTRVNQRRFAAGIRRANGNIAAFLNHLLPLL